MRPVVQEDRTGCGLASVATLAGMSYQQVKKVASQLGISVQDPKLWSDTKYIQTLLAHYGLASSSNTMTFQSWDTLPPLALLAIKWHKPNHDAFWHWVTFYRGPKGPVVFDPKRELHTNSRTDFGRMKPKWYLTVSIPESFQLR